MPAATRTRLAITGLIALACLLVDAHARAQQRGGNTAGLYKSRVTPHWFDGNTKLWYQNDLPKGAREFVLVDAEKGSRGPAFDHSKLAAALRDKNITDATAERLPLERLEFRSAGQVLEFRAGGRNWRCELPAYKLTELNDKPASSSSSSKLVPLDGPRVSRTTGAETELTFFNRSAGEVELFWLDTSGIRRTYGKVAAGSQKAQHTFAGHVWEIVGGEGQSLGIFQASEAADTVEIDGKTLLRPAPASRGGRGRTRPGGRNDKSPDGNWTAFLRDHNVFVRSSEGQKEIQISHDGREGLAYGNFEWSPNSQTLVAFRIEPGEQKEVHLIESSPAGGGRAKLQTRNYALPGDKFTAYEPHLFNIADQKEIPCKVDRIDFRTPRLRWSEGGSKFTYEQVDRGHQRLRLIEINAFTGQHRNLIDERTNTFIWTAHTEGAIAAPITWLEKTPEIIYASERDGWRHLYLVDAQEGAIKNQITQGEYVVRGIDRIDEARRQIWFRASGRNADQDPYLIHYYRVSFDGTGLVALTAGNGTHTIDYSPDEKFFIDRYSRVDQPPIHELRRTEDGQLVCQLEVADIHDLTDKGWHAPEVFSAKGRDGTTDIWGIISRPRNFDPGKKYPVIEHIYAGPHNSHVPKAFSMQSRFSALTDLGFVVVQIDGMGTANRSKAFHDVCWHNLKDAGFPDRILWHQAVAKKHSWYDITRVGIYGGSAGGQNSTGALLFHPEFYKAAVSGCGCHDNRMDKASWN
jgi:dipeptidyl-peptidase-4